jgi:hypothetical protein
MKTFTEALQSFKNEKNRVRIAIYQSESVKDTVLYQDLKNFFGKKYFSEIVDTFFVYSYEAILKNNIDILVVPETHTLRPETFARIKNVIRRGGALILAGNDMLMQERTAEEIEKAANLNNPFRSAEEPSRDPLYYYRTTMAFLGVKPYVSDVRPVKVKFDTDFLEGISGDYADLSFYGDGAKCNTTSDIRDPNPFAGTSFVERYEVLRNYEIATGHDEMGRKLNCAVTFAQDWESGARICLFPSVSKGSFFDKNNPYYEVLLDGAVEFCRNRLVVNYCMPQFVCYKQGETPYIDYKVKSFSDHEEKFEAVVVIMADGKEVFRQSVAHTVCSGGEVKGLAVWNCGKFDTDIYEIAVKVIKNGRIVSRGTNAFVVWNEDILEQGREMFNDGEYFKIDGRRSALLGTNYYDSHTNSAMWVVPNVSKLNADLKQMAEFGINFIRIHYHHPKWFYDFWMQRYGYVPEIYKDLGNSWLPTEKHLRIFDAHVYLCQKYKIIYGGDLFTLLPEELGDPRGWYGVHDYCALDEKFEAHKEFLDLIIPRYKDVPGITWDIINEPVIIPEQDMTDKFNRQLVDWAKRIKKYMLELGERHPITVGDCSGPNPNINRAYTEVSDYLSPHSNWRYAANMHWKNFRGPQFYQEVWMDRPFTPKGDVEQLDDMKSGLIDAFRTGLAGFSPWQWTAQLAMWQDRFTYQGENWDDMLGCCVRHDATIKPAGKFYRDFIWLFGDLSLIACKGNNVIETKEGIITFKSPAETKPGEYYMLLEKEGCHVRGIAKGFCRGKNYSIVTDKESSAVLFDFSREGTAYIKADSECKMSVVLPCSVTNLFITDGIEEKELKVHNQSSFEIDFPAWQTYYWLKFVF